MRLIPTDIPDILLIEPDVFRDARGFFVETWRRSWLEDAGIDADFVQDNHSQSQQWTLRGLHYQWPRAQGKLVRVTAGEVFDVAVDLRRNSRTYGRWVGHLLSAENQRLLWIPPGFGHGFLVTSSTAEFQYKCTEHYDPAGSRCLRWDDPFLDIRWPLPAGQSPVLSAADAAAPAFANAVAYD